jgi:hypothetical protein
MNTRDVKERRWAKVEDEALNIDAGTMGDHPSNDAIGGYFGVAWYEYFKDHATGETYKVHCYDGVYRSKGAFTDEDERLVAAKEGR